MRAEWAYGFVSLKNLIMARWNLMVIIPSKIWKSSKNCPSCRKIPYEKPVPRAPKTLERTA
jgi:hypothetical protein